MAESGSASRRRTRDKERAAYLRKMNVRRDSGRCAICYAIVKNADTLNHYRMHSYQG